MLSVLSRLFGWLAEVSAHCCNRWTLNRDSDIMLQPHCPFSSLTHFNLQSEERTGLRAGICES